ncbi:MAG: hypothetical protein PHE25_00400 [Candidatus Gracilibacteria bacterium]|nr:hypothetical protein [Candidatus Gracilibacteria bacterium]
MIIINLDRNTIKRQIFSKILFVLISCIIGIIVSILAHWNAYRNFTIYDWGNFLLFYISVLPVGALWYIIGVRFLAKKNIIYKIDEDYIIEESSKGIKIIERRKIKKLVNNIFGLSISGEGKKIFIPRQIDKFKEILKDLKVTTKTFLG